MTVVYYALARLGVMLAIDPGNVTLVWPASGVALAAVLLLRGKSICWGIWLGSFTSNVWELMTGASDAINTPLTTLIFCATIGVGSLLQVLVASFIIKRFVSIESVFQSTRGVFILLLAIFLSFVIGATVGVTSLIASSIVEWEAFGFTWITWYLGDAIGAILVTPLIFAFIGRGKSLRDSNSRSLESIAAFILTLGGALAVFVGFGPGASPHESLVYLLIPAVIWLAVRTPRLASASAMLLVSGIAIWGTVQGNGPFVLETLNLSLLHLQLFMGVVMMTGLLMSSSWIELQLANERATRYAAELNRSNSDLRRSAAEMKAVEVELKTIVGTAPDAILTVDEKGLVVSANPSAGLIFGGESSAIVGRAAGDLLESIALTDGEAWDRAAGIRYGSQGFPLVRKTHARRLDGSSFPAEFNWAKSYDKAFTVIVLRDISERDEMENAVVRAAEVEKERIARDLHDGLGSLLGGAGCMVKSLENQLRAANDGVAGKAAEIGDAIKEGIRMTRRLSHGLYAVGSHPNALEEALREFAQSTESNMEVTCGFYCPMPVELDDRILANHMFRIAQEAVANAIRHSGTDTLMIGLEICGRRLRLRVSDEGCGMAGSFGDASNGNRQNGADDDAKSRVEVDNFSLNGNRGLGLRTMNYRAHALNGVLEISSLENEGTTVTCEAPFDRGSTREKAEEG